MNAATLHALLRQPRPLQFHPLAYNLANFLRTLATLVEIEQWSPTSLLERLIKTGTRLVRHARYAAYQFPEAAPLSAASAGTSST